MKTYIDAYIKSKAMAWAPTTLSSEAARLSAIAPALDGNPQTLWNHLKGQKPYSRLTTWVRASAFWDFYLQTTGRAHEGNPYKEFRRSHARLFKYAYTRKPAPVDYETARSRVEDIEDHRSRALARHLLKTGMRYTESSTLSAGEVIGKGGKRRAVFGAKDAVDYPYSYQTFLNHLDWVGLKPHDLRKAFASRLVDKGANVFELQAIMGWSDLKPALSYVRAKETALQALVKKVNM